MRLLVFVLVFVIMQLAISYLMIALYVHIIRAPNQLVQYRPPFSWERTFYVCLIFPIVGTLFFQVFLIKLFRYIIKNVCLSILLSAFLFGLSHYTTVYYQTTAFFSGLLYGLAFALADLRTGNVWKAFAIVFTIHFSYNSIVNILNTL